MKPKFTEYYVAEDRHEMGLVPLFRGCVYVESNRCALVEWENALDVAIRKFGIPEGRIHVCDTFPSNWSRV